MRSTKGFGRTSDFASTSAIANQTVLSQDHAGVWGGVYLDDEGTILREDGFETVRNRET